MATECDINLAVRVAEKVGVLWFAYAVSKIIRKSFGNSYLENQGVRKS